MAGFQKFPVPKYAFIDFWNYNKKWIGNTAFTTFGAFLIFLSMNRWTANRQVIYISWVLEDEQWSWELHRPFSRNCTQNSQIVIYLKFEFLYFYFTCWTTYIYLLLFCKEIMQKII